MAKTTTEGLSPSCGFGHSFGAGQGAVILPGFHVGDGAITGANNVVGSDVESYAIVVGKPRVDLHRTRIPMKAGIFDAFNHIQEQYFSGDDENMN